MNSVELFFWFACTQAPHLIGKRPPSGSFSIGSVSFLSISYNQYIELELETFETTTSKRSTAQWWAKIIGNVLMIDGFHDHGEDLIEPLVVFRINPKHII